MTTVKLKGPGLNNYFAEKLVKDYGPDEAKNRTSGKMLVAVERVIAQLTHNAEVTGAGTASGGLPG